MLVCMRGPQEGNCGLWGCNRKQGMRDGDEIRFVRNECIISSEVKYFSFKQMEEQIPMAYPG